MSNDSSNEITESFVAPPNRIASLDFTRGLAIFLMTFFHGFNHVFDPSWFTSEPSAIFDVIHPVAIAPIGFLVYLGTWNSFFLLVSITVNTLGMVKSAQKGSNLEKILWRRMITGVFLFIADYIIEAFLYYGYFGGGIKNGSWSDVSRFWKHFFGIRTLQIIAWSIIITSIINYFLLRKNGHRKYVRNMIVFGTLALSVLVSTHFVQNAVDNMPWELPLGYDPTKPGWPDIGVQEYNASFKTWIFVQIAGGLEPFFPYLCTAFVGAMIGLTVTLEKPPKYITPIFGSTGLLMMILGAVLIAIGFPFVFDTRSSLPVFMLQLGGQTGLLMLFFRRVEFKGRGRVFANNWMSREFRLWSMASLSIYALEIFDIIPASFMNLIAGRYVGHNFLLRTFNQPHQMGYALLYALFSLTCYIGLVRVWSLINFTGSFEWFLLRVQNGFRKPKINRLDVDLILNKTGWIIFVDQISDIKYVWIHKIQQRFKKTDDQIIE
ncbi:MAG: DUF1624 domain-containing protein [Asgard group archaeon]|nr:DUF1624 domain-containing protein [Asgard group archaeon]